MLALLAFAMGRPDAGAAARPSVHAPSDRDARARTVAAFEAAGSDAGSARAPASPGSVARPASAPARDGEEEEPSDVARSGSEAAHYVAFRSADRDQPGVLDSLAGELLSGPAPEAQQVALLRALHDLRSPRRAEFFLQAIRGLPDEARPGVVSVPAFAVQHLARRAAHSAEDRALLSRVAFDEPRPGDALRGRAAAALFAHASTRELASLRGRLWAEDPGPVLDASLEALARNPDRDEARRILADYDLAGRQSVPSIRTQQIARGSP